MAETILIVDDEDAVRRTFQDWLVGSGLPVRVFAVPDAESALLVANDNEIDLAILDWNLGSGSDGLRLLEDLLEFHPDIVAILITGYAHQATPLDALRKGVRDYLDKNQDLNRETFVAAVKKQLDRITPAKRQRFLNQQLAEFREAVEKVLPLVRASAALNDPVPLPAAVRSLFRFVLRGTGASDGALIVRHSDENGSEGTMAFDPEGQQRPMPQVPFGRTLAASVISLQETCVMNDVSTVDFSSVDLYPFETGRKTLLAVPLRVGTGMHVVMELFDKPQFSADDRRLADLGGEIGAELLRQSLAERQSHRLLFDAVEAALRASDEVRTVISSSGTPAMPTDDIMARLRKGLSDDANALVEADIGLELVDAVRVLAIRHGPAAVKYCVRMVTGLRDILDGMNEPMDLA